MSAHPEKGSIMMRSKHVAAGLFVILGLVSALAYAQIRESTDVYVYRQQQIIRKSC